MSFRCVRRSSDRYTWVTLGLSMCGVICVGIIGLFIFFTDSTFPKVFVSVLWVLFLIAFVFCLRAILFPFEWELVVEGDLIRWGRTSRPDRQRRVSVSQLVRLIHDKSDNQVLADIGSWRLLHVGADVLVRPADQSAVVDYLHQRFPELKIETT